MPWEQAFDALVPLAHFARRPCPTLPDQWPFAEKCWESFADDQSPPQPQPIRLKARSTTSPRTISGSAQETLSDA